MTLTYDKMKRMVEELVKTHCVLDGRKLEQFTLKEVHTQIIKAIGCSKYLIENAMTGIKTTNLLYEIRPNVWATPNEKERLDKEELKYLDEVINVKESI